MLAQKVSTIEALAVEHVWVDNFEADTASLLLSMLKVHVS